MTEKSQQSGIASYDSGTGINAPVTKYSKPY